MDRLLTDEFIKTADDNGRPFCNFKESCEDCGTGCHAVVRATIKALIEEIENRMEDGEYLSDILLSLKSQYGV